MRIYGKQRMDTLNLALAYFIQICARIKIEEKEIAILAAACILIASKLDEIDDNLLTYQDVYSQFLLSKNKFKDLSKQLPHAFNRFCIYDKRSKAIYKIRGKSA